MIKVGARIAVTVHLIARYRANWSMASRSGLRLIGTNSPPEYPSEAPIAHARPASEGSPAQKGR